MKKLIIGAALLAALAGCTQVTENLETMGTPEAAISRALTSAPVVLDTAKAYVVTTLKEYPNYESEGFVTGYIDLANLGYTKVVTIRYKSSGATVWKDGYATYLKAGAAGREIWSFTVRGLSVAERFGFDVEFALRYQVNGSEYWDNNNGTNYKLGAGPRTFNPPVYMGTKNVLLDNATIYANAGYPAQLTAALDIRNLGYNKTVKVRYSGDNWKTWKEVPAQYQYAFGSGLEYWYLQADLTPGTTEVKLAVVYQVNGSEYWDSRYGLNYTVKAGVITR